MRIVVGAVVWLAAFGWAGAQAVETASPSAPSSPIQDNSFLIEEAYNQDDGVVQHINLFRRDLRTGEWLGSFTQEWPIGGIAHQLSYGIAYQRIAGESGKVMGLGDAALNYRYQLVGDGEARIAVAPRLTVLLPTGRWKEGLGSGSAGVQVALPVSFVLSPDWVAHGNIGGTWTPSARDARGDRARTLAGDLGGSVIWLGGGRINGMLEALWSRDQTVVSPGRVKTESSLFVSPGVRWAYDFSSGLQIVPGIGVPIGRTQPGPIRGPAISLLRAPVPRRLAARRRLRASWPENSRAAFQ
ncbi:MAG: transporter [Acidobacteriota bacterium]